MHEIQHFNFGWNFINDFKKEYTSADLSDDRFTTVNIPHTTVEVPFNNFDEKNYRVWKSSDPIDFATPLRAVRISITLN